MASREGFGRILAQIALVVAVASIVLVLAAGPGTRLGLWHFRTGLGLLRWVFYGGLAGGVLGFAAVLLGGARATAGLALFLALGALAVPIAFRRQAAAVPRIHDITTDTQDPPRFDAVLPLRAGADNPPEYAGAEVAAEQRRGYPDLAGLTLALPPEQVFARARQAVDDLGWALVAARPETGTIEATDTTFWFGFKDDVVIRIRPEGSGSRVDVRSKSRVGRSDVGANARRIRRLLDKLR